MVLSETIQFTVLFSVTLMFSVFSFSIKDYKLIFKIIAGICWFVFGLSQFYFFGATQILASPLMLLFSMFGVFFIFSTVDDWRKAKKDELWNFG